MAFFKTQKIERIAGLAPDTEINSALNYFLAINLGSASITVPQLAQVLNRSEL